MLRDTKKKNYLKIFKRYRFVFSSRKRILYLYSTIEYKYEYYYKLLLLYISPVKFRGHKLLLLLLLM